MLSRGGFHLQFIVYRAQSSIICRQPFHTSTSIWAGYKLGDNINDCYMVLRVSKDCENDEIREAYLKLAKEYHPDSGSKAADAKQFAQVDEAYRAIMNHRQKMNQANAEEEKVETDFGIRHTAPQHRQYLTFEGVGFGTPSRREKQYQQYKAQRAADNVYEYKTGKMAAKHENTLVTKDKKETRKNITRSAIDRLVEDLIQESMAKGEFDNLPGKGKPLEYSSHNPLVDITTHNLNKILIQNGYAPEWVNLKKEIGNDLTIARQRLMERRIRAGPEPLGIKALEDWKKSIGEFHEAFSSVNQKINKLNMVTPTMRQQMIPYSDKHIKREIKDILAMYNYKAERGDLDTKKPPTEPVINYEIPDPMQKVKLKDVWNEVKALFVSIS